MKLLVMGGAVFLGRHIVEAAIKHGHEVTLFGRGRGGKGLFTRAERLVGERSGDLGALSGRSWDGVVDVSGHTPGAVRGSADTLRGWVGRYVYVSSVSVYEDLALDRQDEDAPVRVPPAGEPRAIRDETYGALKAGCELVVRDSFPKSGVIVRPGLITGPHDPTDRFAYWPSRVARGGEVLAPGDPERTVQIIDARDLAAWIVTMAQGGKPGTYNACGPGTPMRRMLELCRKDANSPARFTWVDDAFLLGEGMVPSVDIPLWLPGLQCRFDSGRAQAAGLTYRPLMETVHDVRVWDEARPDRPLRNIGLAPEREAELLERWRRRV
ncbi:MAG: NAD-dependent epimerase/dehydratase family protein [Elusimicrobiota bacterium]